MPISHPIASAAPRPGGGAVFVVGRDPGGHWLAVETHGRGGGLFRSREAAVAYARREAADAPVLVVRDPPLDLVFPAGRRDRSPTRV